MAKKKKLETGQPLTEDMDKESAEGEAEAEVEKTEAKIEEKMRHDGGKAVEAAEEVREAKEEKKG